MSLKNISAIISAAVMISLTACAEDSPITNPPVDKTPVEIDRTAFAKGADVSWLTQQEAEGYTFLTHTGTPMECMQLLRDFCGVNSIRLRVWVNPADGWCDINDVVVKARRANALGMRVMIDFHFSDVWADPGNQVTPVAWQGYNIDQLCEAVKGHVNDMLTRLADLGIEPEWVQIGNETRGGFMYPLGSIDNPAQFTQLVNVGYDAVKAVFPNCQVIVHIDSGDRWDLYKRIFGALAANGGKYDMIGLSLYPDVDNWKSKVDSMIANINNAVSTYGKPVMICEVGMDYDQGPVANEMMTYLKSQSETATSGNVKGIFYWEPQAPAGYNGGYKKGCFLDGMPTEALDCFK